MFVEGLFSELTALGPSIVLEGTNYYSGGDDALVSPSQRSTILPFTLKDFTASGPFYDVVFAWTEANPGFDWVGIRPPFSSI